MRKVLAVLLVIWMASLPAVAARADGTDDHTLVVAALSAATAHPKLEYAFFSRYPDGKIIYISYGNLMYNSVQILAGLSPDIIHLDCGQIPRYANADVIENLYENVFPDGYPEALAPQARHLMEYNNRMVGMAEHWNTYWWSIHLRYAEKLGYEIPEDGWTEQDLLDLYFNDYTGDTDGDGELDVWFAPTAFYLDSEGLPVTRKAVYIGAYDAILAHATDLEYLLSEDFLAELEFTRLLATSDKLPTYVDENGNYYPDNDYDAQLFNDRGYGYSGPYSGSATENKRSSSLRARISAPAFLNGEPNNYVSAGYYCLMRMAPHHELATEVMRMMGSEEYQALYNGLGYGGGNCFGAQEPVRELAYSGATNDWQHITYSDEYHTDMRVVDASVLGKCHVKELASYPDVYQAQLELMAGLGNPFYDSLSLVEVCETIFWPAFQQYCDENLTAEQVAHLLYQRLRIAMYE